LIQIFQNVHIQRRENFARFYALRVLKMGLKITVLVYLEMKFSMVDEIDAGNKEVDERELHRSYFLGEED
jgi:hypothetical protein